MIPGEIRVRPEPVPLNVKIDPTTGEDLVERISMVLVNNGDRPIQIGSHLHLPDANPELRFNRAQAEKHRLDIPAGTSVRIEPGASVHVELVPLGGSQEVPGLRFDPVEVPQPVDDAGHRSEPAGNSDFKGVSTGGKVTKVKPAKAKPAKGKHQ